MRNMRITALVALLSLSGSAFAASAIDKQNPMSQFIMLGLFLVFLYFMMIRPQTKRAKEHQSLISSIAKDDEVVTSGGLVGRVTKVTDVFVHILITQGVEVMVQKGMIVSSLPKGTMK